MDNPAYEAGDVPTVQPAATPPLPPPPKVDPTPVVVNGDEPLPPPPPPVAHPDGPPVTLKEGGSRPNSMPPPPANMEPTDEQKEIPDGNPPDLLSDSTLADPASVEKEKPETEKPVVVSQRPNLMQRQQQAEKARNDHPAPVQKPCDQEPVKNGFEDVPIDDTPEPQQDLAEPSAAPEDRSAEKPAPGLDKNGQLAIPDPPQKPAGNATEVDEDYLCGIGTWRPAFLQRFANPWCFMAVFAVSILLQGVFFTYFVSVITTIEKRFEIKSRTTGFVMAGNEISEILFAVLLTYYGGKGHRPRWVSCGIWCIALACFIMASPNFLLGSGVPDIPMTPVGGTAKFQNGTAKKLLDNKKLCRPNATDLLPPGAPQKCEENGEDALEGLSLIFFAFFVAGFGISVVQPLGLSYYDDNVKATQAPVFHGILSASRVIGPFMGYIMGSLCLRLYVIPGHAPAGVELKDPRWIGAWWLGFIILGSLLLVSGFFVCLFPKKLPAKKSSSDQNKAVKQEEAKPNTSNDRPETAANGNTGSLPENSSTEDAENLFTESFDATTRELPAIKEIPDALKRLITNKIFMFHVIAVNFHLLANIGFFAFSPKYLESQFRVSAPKSNLAVGFAGVLVMAVGMLAAGYVIKRFKPGPRTVTAYHVGVTAFNIFGLLCAVFVGCSSINLFGSTDEAGQLNPRAPCNAVCNCSTAEYNVICMELTNVHFYNPCFGGCTGEKMIRKIDPSGKIVNQTVYTGCSCGEATRNFTHATPVSTEIDLTAGVQGFCAAAACSNFVSYLVLVGIIKAVASTARVGNLMVTMRSVEKRDKSIAIGFSLAVFSIFAFIPTPILYGAIIDSTCRIWRETKCKLKGNCAFYDSDRFRVALHLTPAVLLVVSLVMEIFVWMRSDTLDLYEHKEGTEMVPARKKKRDSDATKVTTGADNPAYNPGVNS